MQLPFARSWTGLLVVLAAWLRNLAVGALQRPESCGHVEAGTQSPVHRSACMSSGYFG